MGVHCRAGTTTRFYNGDADSDLDKIAWYAAKPARLDEPVPATTMHPVGQKEPNAWGLYDMLGSVWEWCYDVSHANRRYPGGSITDYVDFSQNAYKGYVMRGGSILNEAESCEITADSGYAAAYAVSLGITGFRVALTQVPRPPSVVTVAYVPPDIPVDTAPLPVAPVTIKDAKTEATSTLKLIRLARQNSGLANPGTHADLLTDFNVLESMANAIISDDGKNSDASSKLLGEFSAQLDETTNYADLILANTSDNSNTRQQARLFAASLRALKNN